MRLAAEVRENMRLERASEQRTQRTTGLEGEKRGEQLGGEEELTG